jgi:hypothetical protein
MIPFNFVKQTFISHVIPFLPHFIAYCFQRLFSSIKLQLALEQGISSPSNTNLSQNVKTLLLNWCEKYSSLD